MNDENRCPGTNRNGDPCGHPAGWGTDTDDGPCKFHGGASTGAPEGNQNAQTHALFADHDGYYHNLDDDAQQWLFDFTHVLLDRHRDAHGKEPDMFDREALKNIAIDFHRVAHANEWFAENGMVQQDIQDTPQSFSKTTKINVWASEIRQYNESIYRRMQKHGLLNDPESQKADAMSDVSQAYLESLKRKSTNE